MSVRQLWFVVLALGATSFIACFGLFAYCDVVRPEPYGFQARFDAGRMVIVSVDPNPASAAARARLRPGDVIVAVDGSSIENPDDWVRIEANLEFGRALPLTIQRREGPSTATFVVEPAAATFWATVPGVVLMVTLAVQGVALLLAIFVVVRRPTDPVAVLGAWVLFTAAVYVVVPPFRVAAVWRQLPGWLGGLLWVPFVWGQAAAAVVCTFFLNFPHRPVRSSVFWIALWMPMGIALGYAVPDAWRLMYLASGPTHHAQPHVRGALTMAYLLIGLTTLLWNYRRLTDANERRRVRIVVVGASLSLVPGLVAISMGRARSASEVTASIFTSPTMVVGTLTLLAFPTSLTYAILRHRVFDIGLIIRQGVRYAVARGALLSVVPMLVLMLAADLVARGQAPLVTLLRARGSLYAVLAAVAIVAHGYRRTWLASIDRRFFREQYQAACVLATVADDIQRWRDFNAVAARAVAHIELALHPEFVALLVRQPSDVVYTSLVATPAGLAPPPLHADRVLAAWMRARQAPLEASDAIINRLPVPERTIIRDCRTELMIPVVGQSDQREGILMLGGKRSEQPYSREDRQLLTIIAVQLGLLLDRPAVSDATSASPLRECPVCGLCYDDGVVQCDDDRATLLRTDVPRLLAGRYLVRRRLGGGGFGTVYEARDTALDRQVAVKLLCERVRAQPDAFTRFQKEAKLAARFVHPNVVTVHDFGIDASGRPFLVMECLAGVTLREALRGDGPLDLSRTTAILRGLCAAVDAAHRHDLIHGDLKPENVFLARTGGAETAKVLDFGVARAVEEPREVSIAAVAGSLRYLAPTQLRGEAITPAVDIWALAIIAFEMIVGEHPFAGCSLATVTNDVSRDAVPGIPVDVPAAWRPFFCRTLAVEPDPALTTAVQLLAAFEAARGRVAA